MSEHGPCVFVGGPIQFLHDSSNTGAVIACHQEIIAALRAAGFRVLSAHEAEDYGNASASFGPAEVTVRDYEWTRACDVYVGVIPTDQNGIPYRSDGTHIEIGWATALGKPVILLLAVDAARPYGHLVMGLIETGRATMVPLSAWRRDLAGAVLEHIDPTGMPDQRKSDASSARRSTTMGGLQRSSSLLHNTGGRHIR